MPLAGRHSSSVEADRGGESSDHETCREGSRRAELALLVWSTLHAQDDYSDKVNTNLGGGPGSRHCYGISTLIDPTLVRTTAVALC